MSLLPYPTPTRLRLAESIIAGHIRHYHFTIPETRDEATDSLVTARIQPLVAAGLVDLGAPQYEGGNSRVWLTPAGAEWYARGTAGSTSPEPGPEGGA